MKNETKRKNLKIYEENVKKAAQVRTAKVGQAEQEYQDEIKRQKQLFQKAMAGKE